MSGLLRTWLPPSNFGKLDSSVLGNYKNLYLIIQLMGKKKRRKVEKVVKTQEHKDSSIRYLPLISLYDLHSDTIRLQDRLGTPETTISMSKTIRNQINLAYRGYITRKHIARFRKYKELKDSGMTHDTLERLPSSFVTPLTKLQHQSTLPSTLAHQRHTIPHLLHYKVSWYGTASPAPSTQNNHCFVSFNINSIGFTSKQKEMLKEIIGRSRYEEKSGIAMLESTTFDNLNYNAAYLGDIFEKLINTVRRV